ncbi:MAG: hypothetical protein LLG37_03585 [Spirochaetia bacterium]|nr:hypothetical protein [Spirochaetia bacterium]
MKKLTVIAAAIVMAFAMGLYAADKLVIDDCDDGDAQGLAGGWWYAYNDSQSGGNSTVTPGPGKFEMAKQSKGYAAQLKGTVGNKLGWDFIGMGVTLTKEAGCPTAKPVDVSKYTTLTFKMKGTFTGGRLVVRLPYTENKCAEGSYEQKTLTEWADYEVAINSKLSKDWVTVRLDLRKDFKQPKWAKKNVDIETVLKNLKNLDFHFSSPDGDSIDVTIDEIAFE